MVKYVKFSMYKNNKIVIFTKIEAWILSIKPKLL